MRKSSTRYAILQLLQSRGPLLAAQIRRALTIGQHTCSAAVYHLAELGYLEADRNAGKWRDRPYHLTHAGRDQLRPPTQAPEPKKGNVTPPSVWSQIRREILSENERARDNSHKCTSHGVF